MAFGLPGTESVADGQFLGRIQYDTRVGFWKIVRRIQHSDGSWGDEDNEPFKNPTFLVDFGSLEVGFIKFASPPAFVLVPYGHELPARPQEMRAGDDGRQVNAFLPGFRIKVCSPKLFSDNDAYHFAHTAKTVLTPMDDLHQRFLKAPEAATGLVPLVACTGTSVITAGRQGAKFYAPEFTIQRWMERPECFGERTVPPPSSPAAPASAASKPASASRHVGPPAAKAPAMADTSLDDEIPF